MGKVAAVIAGVALALLLRPVAFAASYFPTAAPAISTQSATYKAYSLGSEDAGVIAMNSDIYYSFSLASAQHVYIVVNTSYVTSSPSGCLDVDVFDSLGTIVSDDSANTHFSYDAMKTRNTYEHSCNLGAGQYSIRITEGKKRGFARMCG